MMDCFARNDAVGAGFKPAQKEVDLPKDAY